MKWDMRSRKKKHIFIFQITDTSLKVVKCLADGLKREFVAFEAEAIPEGADDKAITERLNINFKKLRYDNDPVIASLPLANATLRSIRVPADSPEEIKKIISLQAPRFLPYPVNELITGYQVISREKDGYSRMNLIIVHKDVVERYLKFLRQLKAKDFTIVLNSYGICNLYSNLKGDEPQAAIVIDIDSDRAELAVVAQKKLLFSRYFKIERSRSDWESLFIEEVKRSRDAYAKEGPEQVPQKIFVLGKANILQGVASALNKQTALPVEILSYAKKINLPEQIRNNIVNLNDSFAGLIGLGMGGVSESLYLLPEDIKEQRQKLFTRKGKLKSALLIGGILLMWLLSAARGLENKAEYLKRVKTELNKISAEAKPLEEIDNRAKILQMRSRKALSAMDVLYGVHQAVPPGVSLVTFNYEEDARITMRGEAKELNSVFDFVSQLEGSPEFRNFNVKVRYATKKKTQAGEIIDFEIGCLKK